MNLFAVGTCRAVRFAAEEKILRFALNDNGWGYLTTDGVLDNGWGYLTTGGVLDDGRGYMATLPIVIQRPVGR